MRQAAARELRDELNALPNGLDYLVGWDPKGGPSAYYVFVDRHKVKDPRRIIIRDTRVSIGDGFLEACDEAMKLNPDSWHVVHRPGMRWAVFTTTS